MKVNNDLLVMKKSGNVMLDDMFKRYLNNQMFRGFYYDRNETNYGIILEFGKSLKTSFKLIANKSQFSRKVAEYSFESKSFTVEPISYDKLMINSHNYTSEILINEKEIIQFPETIEFSIQLLTRNSMFLQFINFAQYSSPINSFKGGLVLSREQKNRSEAHEKISLNKTNDLNSL